MISEKIKDRKFITVYITPEVIFIDKFLHSQYLIFVDFDNCLGKKFAARFGIFSNYEAIRKFLRSYYK
jgi:hypothetical protein